MPRRLAGAAVSLAAIAATPLGAHACAIDGYASLRVDGVPAMHTSAPPAPGRAWAPFTAAQAVAAGQDVRLGEQAADLARSLPAAWLAAPYRWSFGDGSRAAGRTVAHRYARPGLYVLRVSAFEPRTRRWLVFDAALLRVVPPGRLLQTNAAYAALSLVLLLEQITWLLSAVSLVAVGILLASHTRRR